MKSYYNEIDAKCCAVLQSRIDEGRLPAGYVDQRSIEDVQPQDVDGYDECHFFAGIGGFPLGFYRAGLNLPDGVRLWSGGFPCQDLSVAGQRAGLAGGRSGLWFEFHRLIASCRPEWLVIENVPGLLSSHEGRDFAVLLGGLTGVIPEVPADGWGNAGFARGPFYSVVYRILDAQYDGVPQRRRRVFVVASSPAARGSSAQVLFERESSAWDPPPSREAGQGAAIAITERTRGTGRQLEYQRDAAYCLDNPGNGGRAQTRLIVPPIAGTLRSASDSPAAHGKVNGTDRSTLVCSVRSVDSGHEGLGRDVGGVVPDLREGRDPIPSDESERLAPGVPGDAGPTRPTAFGGNNTSGPIDVATACNAHGSRRYDFESETFVASPLQASLGHHGHSSPRGDGSDNLVAVDMRNLSQSGDVTHPLQSKSNGGYSLNYQPCVAYGMDSEQNVSEEQIGTIRSHQSGGSELFAFQPRYYTRDNKPGGQPSDTADITNCHKAGDSAPHVVAYGVAENQRAEVLLTPYSRQLTSGGGKPGQGYPCVAFDYTVQGSERTRIVRSGEYAQIRAGAVDAVFARSTGAGFYTEDDKGSVRAQTGGTTYDLLGQSWGVRRLTPVECCRLQGLPDDWVDGEGQSDSAKYRQLGNAVCEPVVRWIGQRIHAVVNGGLL